MGFTKKMEMEEHERAYAEHLAEVRARAEAEGIWDEFQDEEVLDAMYEALDKDD